MNTCHADNVKRVGYRKVKVALSKGGIHMKHLAASLSPEGVKRPCR